MKPTRLVRLGSLLAILAAAPVWAASPREELLRLVPEDVGFCLVIQDLRGHAAALVDSPFAEQFRQSVFGKAIASAPELVKIQVLGKTFKEHLGIDGPQLRDDILGDAIVAAYRPGPPGKPEQEQGIFLVRARNATLLASLIERFNQAQKKSGDLIKLEERDFQGVKYYLRIDRNQKPQYYWLDGPVLAISGQESILQQVIERGKEAPSVGIEVPPIARQLQELNVDKALLALWVNPRAFDAEVQQRAKVAPPSEAVPLQTFQTYWKALRGAAFFVAPGQNLRMGWAFRANPDELPPAARKFLAEAAKPSELWSAFPDDALLAVAGRIDVPALVETIGGFMPEEARKALLQSLDKGGMPILGKIARELTANLGPDVGFCITAPAAEEKSWLPHAAWAIRVRPGSGKQPADQALLDALNFFAGLAVLDYNSKNTDRMSLRTVQQDKVEVKYFVNEQKFPPGFQPAFALKDGYLVITDSPDTVRRFQVKREAVKESAEVPLVRISLKSLRRYLEQRREPLLAHAAEKHQLSREEAARRLDGLVMGLQFLDRIELVHRSAPGRLKLTLQVRMTQPLRK